MRRTRRGDPRRVFLDKVHGELVGVGLDVGVEPSRDTGVVVH